MRALTRLVPLLGSIILFGSVCHSASITGSVKDSEGAPFQGSFVEARNTKTQITVTVLTDSKGHYRIENLPAGEYRVQIKAVGYRTNPHTGVNLTPDQNTSVDISLEKGTVHW